MFFKKIFMDDTGSLSYLIGCTTAGVACVVNPKRNVHDYLEAARRNGMTITHIFESRRHSSALAAAMELKLRTRADIYFINVVNRKTHHICRVGDVFRFGRAALNIIDCPSADPYGNAILVTDETDAKEPWAVLGRESLFIGDIAKPGMTDVMLRDAVANYLDGNLQTDQRQDTDMSVYREPRPPEYVYEFAASSA